MLFSVGFLIAVLAGEDDVVTQTLLLGVFSAAGLITGAVRLLGRRSPTVLFGSSLASVAVLLLALLAAAVTIDRTSGLDGIVLFVLFAMVLPVVTAVFAWLPVVRGWAADRPE
jgi:4-amino-4-deoxy-L-arabinose transferase-like glycosyltransferase